MGFSERYLGSVYIAQCTINSDGALLMTRRKLKPVHMERTIFGDGDGPSLLNVGADFNRTGWGALLWCKDGFFETYKK